MHTLLNLFYSFTIVGARCELTIRGSVVLELVECVKVGLLWILRPIISLRQVKHLKLMHASLYNDSKHDLYARVPISSSLYAFHLN